ncbi:MAG: glucose-6-phosphate dehydrogenase [Candidatus Hodarchaeales archaeon]|jgi:glucose-6-phosphate 1-dehydrogenase
MKDKKTISKTPVPHLFILFGASGDLSKRKILPALYNLVLEGMVPNNFCILGISRRIKSNLTFHELFFDSLVKYSSETWKIDVWNDLKSRAFGLAFDIYQDESFDRLKEKLIELNEKFNLNMKFLFYLATAPKNYFQIVHRLYGNELLSSESKIVIEKPFGLDLHSAKQLNNDLLKYLNPSQIFKIDHYLGKESIQNILVFRKNNPLIESIWSKKLIDSIEIIVAETVGVDKRADYFEQTGILKDMIQSHLLQILALLTMEIPDRLDPESLKKSKITLLSSVRKYTEEEALKNSIRGQYDKGKLYTKRSGIHEVNSYREEEGINPKSNTETFVALKTYIDNDQWEGIPFFFITGKRMRKRVTEIRIKLKHQKSEKSDENSEVNMIKLRIQPRPRISIRISFLQPGILSTITPTDLKVKGERIEPKAYERLLLDAMNGDQSAFIDQEEIEEQWKIVEPFAKAWEKSPPKNLPNYKAGSIGPDEVRNFIKNFSF